MAFKIGDKYYHDDAESGEIVEISKQAYEVLGDMVERIKAMIKTGLEIKGTIQILSTPADDFGGDDHSSLWKQWKDQE